MAIVWWRWHRQKSMFLSFPSVLASCPPRQLHPRRKSSNRLGTSVCLGRKYKGQCHYFQQRGRVTSGRTLCISVARFSTSVKWGRDARGNHGIYLKYSQKTERPVGKCLVNNQWYQKADNSPGAQENDDFGALNAATARSSVFLALLSKPFVKSEKEWTWEVRASCGLRTAGTLGWLVCPLGKDRIFLKNFTGISEAMLVS